MGRSSTTLEIEGPFGDQGRGETTTIYRKEYILRLDRFKVNSIEGLEKERQALVPTEFIVRGTASHSQRNTTHQMLSKLSQSEEELRVLGNTICDMQVKPQRQVDRDNRRSER